MVVKKIAWGNFQHFSTPSNRIAKKILDSLDSSKPYGSLLENPMTGGARELLVPENDFKAFSAVKLPKKHPDCGGLKTN